MSLIEDIKSFVEGRTSAKNLYEKVKSSPESESFFDGFFSKPYTNDGSLYLYIISQNYDNPATSVNLQDVMAKFLDFKGIPYSQDDSALREYELILKSSPDWLSLPEFYIEKIKDDIKGADTKQARSIVKDVIKRDFVSLGKPPKWLQSPEWQFDDNQPMIFVGQLSLDKLKHDTSQIYIFINSKNEKVHSVIQTA